MPFAVFLNATQYILPNPGENYAWALGPSNNGLNAYLTALSVAASTTTSGCYQPSSGSSLPLTTPLDFGSSNGILAKSFTSKSANPASVNSGIVKLANGDPITWRNAANTGDVPLYLGTLNQVVFGAGISASDLTGNPVANYTTASGQTFTSGTPAQLNYATQEYDSNSAVTTGATWKFTVPATGNKGGTYLITASMVLPTVASGATSFTVYKNGSAFRTLWSFSGAVAANTTATGHAIIVCNAGDTLDVRLTQNSGGSVTSTATALNTWINIARIIS